MTFCPLTATLSFVLTLEFIFHYYTTTSVYGFKSRLVVIIHFANVGLRLSWHSKLKVAPV